MWRNLVSWLRYRKEKLARTPWYGELHSQCIVTGEHTVDGQLGAGGCRKSTEISTLQQISHKLLELVQPNFIQRCRLGPYTHNTSLKIRVRSPLLVRSEGQLGNIRSMESCPHACKHIATICKKFLARNYVSWAKKIAKLATRVFFQILFPVLSYKNTFKIHHISVSSQPIQTKFEYNTNGPNRFPTLVRCFSIRGLVSEDQICRPITSHVVTRLPLNSVCS